MTDNVSPILSANLSIALDHLVALFGRAMEGKIEITAIKAAEEKVSPRTRFFRLDQLDEAAQYAVDVNREPQWNVYVGAALRRESVFPGSAADDTDFLRTYAVWADADNGFQVAKAKAVYDSAGLPPTMIVVTGRAPEKRAQFWWTLETPITDIETVRATTRGIADALNTDHAVCTGKQLMRLAGTLAWPKPNKVGRVLELTQLVRLERAPREITLEQIHRAYPPAERPAPQYTGAADDRPGSITGTLAAPDLRSALASMRADDRELWVRMGHALKELGDIGRGLWFEWSQTSDKYDPADAARVWESFKPNHTGHQAVFAEAQRRGWANPRKGSAPHPEPEGDAETGEVADDDGPFRAADFRGEPPERQWVVREWIAQGAVNSMYGDGGLGKTLLAQQLACAVSMGAPWLGVPTKQGSVLAILCEDDKDELHRRHNDIKAASGYAVGNPFADVWLWPRVGRENILIRWDKDSRPVLGAFYARIFAEVTQLNPSLLILDTLADFYAGNEIDRPSVNYFVKTVLGGLIKSQEAAGQALTVLLLGHPSVAGKASGAGYSGSTAWNNAVRSRMYLTRPEEGASDERILTRGKANYAKSGDETALRLFYANGVLHACEDTEDGDSMLWAAKEEAVRLTDAAWVSGRPYSAQKTHARYIFKALAEDMARGGFNGGLVRQALRELILDDGVLSLSKGKDRRGYRSAKHAS